MRLTRQCVGCKEVFRKTELIEYFSSSGKTSNWYCPKCLEEKQARERFSNKVCEIFGLKAPGPVIWTQRKRIQNEYGYTDDTIVGCLDYIYKVKNLKKLSESLGLINPRMVEEYQIWKKQQENKTIGIVAAIANTETFEHIVPIKENNRVKKEINLDDGLFDD